MGSTRLPGKVLADIEGEPMLGRIVARVQHSRQVQKIVVATSDALADDPIAEFCEHKGVGFFRGHETDVLDRFYHAAKAHAAEVIVRITGDCPLIDPEVIDRVVCAFLNDGCDYASNILVCTYPDGLDTEVFSFAGLETAWRDARRATDREHVTPYLRTSKRFRLRNVESELGRSLRHLRWTVDEPRDLQFVRAVYARLHGKKLFGWREVLSLLDAEPDLGRLNSDLMRLLSLARQRSADARAEAHSAPLTGVETEDRRGHSRRLPNSQQRRHAVCSGSRASVSGARPRQPCMGCR
jgi:spore coat polysaccharide biosynthesis protein SpsF (cytidylyltransferase family)